jgi:formylmethanofuran dehydrogenase subunit E
MEMEISEVQKFHGHMCPGLAIGIRIAEQALLEMGERPGDEEVIALVETDSCSVDAIQFLTGCTFGKGNLIHLDYGKSAFRFIRRSDGKAVRIISRSDAFQPPTLEEFALMQRIREGKGNQADIELVAENRLQRIEKILSMPLTDLVEVQKIEPKIPTRARIHNSIGCDRCGEKTMETRLHLLEGKMYCFECFEKMMLND